MCKRFTWKKANVISQQTQTLNKDKLFEKKIYVNFHFDYTPIIFCVKKIFKLG